MHITNIYGYLLSHKMVKIILGFGQEGKDGPLRKIMIVFGVELLR